MNLPKDFHCYSRISTKASDNYQKATLYSFQLPKAPFHKHKINHILSKAYGIPPLQWRILASQSILHKRKENHRNYIVYFCNKLKEKMAEQINNAMVNMDEEEEEDDDDDDEENNDNDNNDNAKQDDEQHQKIKGHKSRRKKGSNNSRSMATLLTEIHRGGEKYIQERSLGVDSNHDNSDKTARSSCASNISTRRQMQLQPNDTTSEEDNDDMAPDAANDCDADADAASSDKASVDDDIDRTEKYLRLYFNSLAKSRTICTVEKEFNLVTA